MKLHKKNKILYSPSDLVTFLSCSYANFLDKESLRQKISKTEPSSTVVFLQEKGLEHETAILKDFYEQGCSVVEISKEDPLTQRVQKTKEALRRGVDVIYQASFLKGDWCGDADFLLRCSQSSSLGSHSYEVLETKLGRSIEASYIIQLCLYTELLSFEQGMYPEYIHLILGDGQKHVLKVRDYRHYTSYVKSKFERSQREKEKKMISVPCRYCSLCSYREYCRSVWDKKGDLCLIANIKRQHIKSLQEEGIDSIDQLVCLPLEKEVRGINQKTFRTLYHQARLQYYKRQTGKDRYEVLTVAQEKSIRSLPPKNEGDLFFDMEGDPFYEGGLEYLFGLYYENREMKQFIPFWAHNHKEEKETLIQFMAFLKEHLQRYPQAYIYHYNHYETTALKRLSCRYAVCEEVLDTLLRQEKFVDLYVTVRDNLRTSESGYSIKNLETFYMPKREEAVATAVDSITTYNRWRLTRDDILLNEIADYNKVDCVSTKLLRDWLLELPQDTCAKDSQVETLVLESNARQEWEIEYEEYAQRLGIYKEGCSQESERLAHLLEFHRREAKPQWWNAFSRKTATIEELIDDAECIGGLKQIEEGERVKQSVVYTYQFPAQEYKIKKGMQVVQVDQLELAGSVVSVDDSSRKIKIKRSIKKGDLPKEISVGPPFPINSGVIRSALYRYADYYLNSSLKKHVGGEILFKKKPRLYGGEKELFLSHDMQKDVLKNIQNLDYSYLFIQGPPGTGKTYTISHVIVELLKSGRRIGVTSNSHKAIHHLLSKIEMVAKEKGVSFTGIKKSSSQNKETYYEGSFISSVDSTEKINLSHQLFAGTVFTFSHQHFEYQLDYLFIDEAGQVALANVMAMSMATKNIIFVGDQMQLSQPIQGVHPGDTGQSICDYLLEGQATIPKDRGLFLSETRRLNPVLCQFISQSFYDGRLKSHAVTKMRKLINLENQSCLEGIDILWVDHQGCSQKNLKEAEIIDQQYQFFLKQRLEEDGA